jgi:hypothetical protein
MMKRAASLDMANMAIWRMGTALKESIERRICSGFPLGLIKG